jgi:hypothetical protein
MKLRVNNRFLHGLGVFLVSLGSILALFWLLRLSGDNTITWCMIGLAVGFVLLLAYAWVQLYRLWKRYFYRTPMSGVFQIMNLLVWLLLVSVVGSVTVFLLRLFGLF